MIFPLADQTRYCLEAVARCSRSCWNRRSGDFCCSWPWLIAGMICIVVLVVIQHGKVVGGLFEDTNIAFYV
jgi:hypothetical protein